MNPEYDLIVIGGGPAGMMAAGRAAERGQKVLLLEKNKGLGEKLLTTGGGRCNLTNAEFNTRVLLPRYTHAEPFLYSAFAQWDVKNTIDFFESRGMQTKIENENRVFPVSDSARSVWEVLVKYMEQYKVEVRTHTTVEDFTIDGVTVKGKKIQAKKYILATGCTGPFYTWLKKLGHTVHEEAPSLVPLKTSATWVKKLQGLTLPSVKLTLYQSGIKEYSKKGKILFTHFGITGPTVLNMSSDAIDFLHHVPVEIGIDFFPDMDHGAINEKLQELFKEHSNKFFENCLGELLPSTLAPVLVHQTGIDPKKRVHSITREERMHLIGILKDSRIPITGALSERAIVSSGGVALDEVDWKTMQSKVMPNLYLIGDVLDINRPSGGFSLQLCWTTGFVAGNAV